MADRHSGARGRAVAAGIAVAGVVGLGLLTMESGAGAAPELPPVTPEDLVSSVLAAKPGPFNGSAELDNSLGLPALPGAPQAANGKSSGRIWSDGEERGRVQLPSGATERTLVSDGTTLWSWDSAERKVTKIAKGDRGGRPEHAAADPTAAAKEALDKLRPTSVIRVDGTAEVAGRAAYELVLTPAPSERTLLREVRIAVDGEKRVPLRLTVLATGSPDPALQAGFTEIGFGPQDPALFTFTPPPGATVEEKSRTDAQRPDKDADRAIVGEGWDTVVVAKIPPRDPAKPEGNEPDLSKLGKQISGPWGSGRLITSAVGSAIVTDDGRFAAGAVPEQVLTEALAK